MLNSKEWYELIDSFEKKFSHMRLTREKDEKLKRIGIIYESGETNNSFQAYQAGYAFGKSSFIN